MQSVRLGWDQLTAVQQWMCEQVLGVEPASEDEKPEILALAYDVARLDGEPPPCRTQADKWAMHYASAR
ncbi:hypothetical protein [Streptomyces prasinus]|uniref:hypothetical protein n=1 Tax=Streptomyces prasinus TaxID=67345 RepID=UPI0036A8230E